MFKMITSFYLRGKTKKKRDRKITILIKAIFGIISSFVENTLLDSQILNKLLLYCCYIKK